MQERSTAKRTRARVIERHSQRVFSTCCRVNKSRGREPSQVGGRGLGPNPKRSPEARATPQQPVRPEVHHLCFRYNLLPMSPGWTTFLLASPVGLEPTTT